MQKKLEIGVEVAPTHAFARGFVKGVSDYAIGRRNWRLKAITQDGLTVDALRHCDGAILRVIGKRGERIVRGAAKPVVDIYCERPLAGIAQLTVDEAATGRIAAEFFLARGFTHFGFCGLSDMAYSNKNFMGFKCAVERRGFTVACYAKPRHLRGRDILEKKSPYHEPDALDMQKWLMAIPRPAAVFCCNDHRAYQLMQVALKSGLNIPRDVAILGCDDDESICNFAPVPISSIDTNAEKVGRSAARLLDAIMRQTQNARPRDAFLIPPKGLVERESTEIVHIGPPWMSEAMLAIEHDLADGIAASDVFRLSGYSPPHVEKVFRQRFGMSVQAYITEQRLQKARALLKDGNLITKEIAAACGYASPQYFCRVFKERFKCSPLDYRHLNQ